MIPGYLPCICNKLNNNIKLPTNSEISKYLLNTNYIWLNLNTFKNLHDTPIKLHCNKCNHDFQYTFNNFKYFNKLNINCPICNPIENLTQQDLLNQFIQSLNLNTITNYNPEYGKKHSYECDIFIPELNIRNRI